MKLLAISYNNWKLNADAKHVSVKYVNVTETPKFFILQDGESIPSLYISRLKKSILNVVTKRYELLLLLTDKPKEEAIKIWNEDLKTRIATTKKECSDKVEELSRGILEDMDS